MIQLYNRAPKSKLFRVWFLNHLDFGPSVPVISFGLEPNVWNPYQNRTKLVPNITKPVTNRFGVVFLNTKPVPNLFGTGFVLEIRRIWEQMGQKLVQNQFHIQNMTPNRFCSDFGQMEPNWTVILVWISDNNYHPKTEHFDSVFGQMPKTELFDNRTRILSAKTLNVQTPGLYCNCIFFALIAYYFSLVETVLY